jgi:hypothetical protein
MLDDVKNEDPVERVCRYGQFFGLRTDELDPLLDVRRVAFTAGEGDLDCALGEVDPCCIRAALCGLEDDFATTASDVEHAVARPKFAHLDRPHGMKRRREPFTLEVLLGELLASDVLLEILAVVERAKLLRGQPLALPPVIAI